MVLLLNLDFRIVTSRNSWADLNYEEEGPKPPLFFFAASPFCFTGRSSGSYRSSPSSIHKRFRPQARAGVIGDSDVDESLVVRRVHLDAGSFYSEFYIVTVLCNRKIDLA